MLSWGMLRFVAVNARGSRSPAGDRAILDGGINRWYAVWSTEATPRLFRGRNKARERDIRGSRAAESMRGEVVRAWGASLAWPVM
jgi:hypothetical protein